MTTPMLYLMLGYPGSGKTTTAKIIHQLTGAEHIWADHERKQMFGTPTYTHEENVQLYAKLNDLAEKLIVSGKSVIFDTNFNFYKDRQRLRHIAARHGAHAVVIWIVTPKDIARGRATKDAHKQHTRVLGDMNDKEFDRLAGNLQKPHDTEDIITLDGTTIDMAIVAHALEQHSLSHMTPAP